MNKKNKSNLESLANEIWENFFNYDLHTYRLELFEDAMKTISSRYTHELSFLDTLFLEDNAKVSALSSMVQNNGHQLFISLLEKYKTEFKEIEPEKWSFVFWFEKNNCHDCLLNFYGKEYFKNILNPNNYDFTAYHYDFFSKYYLSGTLDNSFTMNNLKNCHENFSINMVHALNFYESNKDEFKNFILNIIKEPNAKDYTNLKFHRFIYLTRRGSNPPPNGNAENNQIFNISLPSDNEISLLIKKWGISKTSQLLSEYLNFQHECLKLIENKGKIILNSELMENLIKKDLQFNNCGEILAIGLRDDRDVFSYFILNGSISTENILNSMQNSDLYKKAHYQFLNETLEDESILLKSRKIKI